MTADRPARLESGTPGIAEDAQLLLQQHAGRLEMDQAVPVAGALLELALLGRIAAVRKKGPFVGPVLHSRLIVVDSEPTGQEAADAVLAVMTKKTRPQWAHRVILSTTRVVLPLVHRALEARGFVRIEGVSPTGHLAILTDSGFVARRDALARARSLPSTVQDPRLGAVIDVVRGGGNPYQGATGEADIELGDWYPPQVRATAQAIISGERMLTGSQ